eukprot:m.78457 g.78457  ORF g.78457 m.78457 type:complete len:87 (+) comp10713_c0_seq1:262-522(+)
MKRSWCNRVPAQVLVPLQCTLIWDNEMHTPHTPPYRSQKRLPPSIRSGRLLKRSITSTPRTRELSLRDFLSPTSITTAEREPQYSP